MIDSPWAILLCKFSDDDAEPYPRSRYEEIFTSAAAGKWNMVDYFRDMSHGQLDLTGSEVFGWFTLDQKRDDYKGHGGNPDGRQQLIDWARAKATAEGVELARFFSVVVVMNVDTDLFGGPNGVVTADFTDNDQLSALSPSVLGQEMAHTYGLDHSGATGSDEAYADPYDVMSTAVFDASMAPHPVYTDELDLFGRPRWRIGPGLNAANMWSRGWLDMSRVWQDSGSRSVDATVQLRPLHRRDLPGFLALKFRDFFIEFRVSEDWDAGFEAAVLVHVFEYGRSFLEVNDAGQREFGVGDTHGADGASLFGSVNLIKVTELDSERQVATVRVVYAPGKVPQHLPGEPPPFRNPGVAWTELVGPDEAFVVVNGQALHLSRRSPVFETLEEVARYSSAALFSSRLADTIRAETMKSIATRAQQVVDSQRFRSPAPLLPPIRQSSGDGPG
jgi:hypothetical protein